MSVWEEISDDYKEFINREFRPQPDGRAFLDIKIVGDEPEPFINKWNRQQWRISVIEIETEYRTYTTKGQRSSVLQLVLLKGTQKYLAGGKKLFATLKRAHDSNHQYIRLIRSGSGFSTSYQYEVVSESKQKKLD